MTAAAEQLADPYGEALAALQSLSSIVEESSRAVAFISPTGTISYANARFCELTGYSRSDLSRMTIFDLAARPREEEVAMWQSLSAGNLWQGHIPGKRKHGEQFWVRAFVLPIRDPSRSIVRYFAVLDEIAGPAQSDVLTSAPPDVVMLTDTEGTILYISETAPGVSREAVTGDSMFNCVPPEHHDRLRAYVDQVIRTKEPALFEMPSVGPHGSVALYVTQVGPVQRRGEVVALSFVTSDVTRRQGRQPTETAITAPRPRRKRRAAAPRRASVPRQPVELSKRESEVLQLLAQGLTNRQVAGRLRVSLRTVDHHVSHILNKLGVPNRTAAVMAARRTGLL